MEKLLIQWLQLDTWINDNIDKLSKKEYEIKVEELIKLTNIINNKKIS